MIAFRLFHFADLALQESLHNEYNKVFPSLTAVRVSRTDGVGGGRCAVIYFSSATDARKAAEETRLLTNGIAAGAEASLLLAGDDLVEEK